MGHGRLGGAKKGRAEIQHGDGSGDDDMNDDDMGDDDLGGGGLWWLAWLLAGPTLWALAFSAAYGLHGLGCAWGWPAVPIGPVSLHRLVLIAVWLAGLGVCGLLACGLRLPRLRPALGPAARLPRLGLWIGFVAILFTLAPVWVASSC